MPARLPTASPADPPSSLPARPPANIEPAVATRAELARGQNLLIDALPRECLLHRMLHPFLGHMTPLSRSAVAIPGPKIGRGVDWPPLPMKLEVQVTRRRAGVSGPADVADDLADVDEVALSQPRGTRHVRVPVPAPLPKALDDDEVPVEPGIERPPDHDAGAGRGERRPAARGDVEPLVPAAAVARGAELPDGASRPVRRPHREEVAA